MDPPNNIGCYFHDAKIKIEPYFRGSSFFWGGGGSPKYLTKYHQENVRSVQVKYQNRSRSNEK